MGYLLGRMGFFNLLGLALRTPHSPIPYNPFLFLHSPFPMSPFRHSLFPIPHYLFPFPIPYSPFPIPYSPFPFLSMRMPFLVSRRTPPWLLTQFRPGRFNQNGGSVDGVAGNQVRRGGMTGSSGAQGTGGIPLGTVVFWGEGRSLRIP